MSKTPNPQTPLPATKTCAACGEEKEIRLFSARGYGASCQKCVLVGAEKGPKLLLAEQVAEYVRQKRIRREERQLLRKEAEKRLAEKRENRRRKAKAASVKKLIPQVEPDTPETPKVDAASREIARRVLARRRLIEFTKQFYPRYKAGWVHHDICRRLEKFSADVAAGLSPRLMILMPPRHGKSQLASKMFPAWHLGHNPEHEFIGCSYNIDLARDFSRDVRALVRMDRYGKIFPDTKIDPDIQSAEGWKLLPKQGTIEAGGLRAAGVGGGITGKGAHVLVIDDPIKNAEEADSAEKRESNWDWYVSTAYTRLAPGGGVLIIQTCWHDDDLAGRIQAAMKTDPEFDQFEVVKYPAIAEEDEEFRVKGDPLHEERYGIKQLLQIKRTLSLKGPRWWSALYQQNPVPEDGSYFTSDMLVTRTEDLDWTKLYIYQAWDFAITEKKASDYTVGVTIGVDYFDTAHVLEVVRFKTVDSDKIVNAMLDMFARWPASKGVPGVQTVVAEDGQIWKTMATLFHRRCQERRLYPSMSVLQPVTDKQVRARPLQGRMAAHKVTLPRSASWLEDLTRELLRFPAGVHDDIVDALAWCVTVILGKAPPSTPQVTRSRQDETVAGKLKKLAGLAGGGAMAA